jgi:dihydrofolate reductase
MRKVILGLGISLDGYIARKSGAVDWLSMDWDYDWTAFFKQIDAVLMGRKSWDVALAMTPPEKRNSNPYGATETYVFSNTLETSGVAGVEIVSGDLKTFVGKLKQKTAKTFGCRAAAAWRKVF